MGESHKSMLLASHADHAGGHAAAHAAPGLAPGDDWHHHTASEGQPKEESASRVRPLLLVQWLVAIIGAVVLVVIGLAKLTEVVTTSVKQELAVNVTNDYTTSYTTKRTTVENELGINAKTPVYAPMTGGFVRIPIDDAMNKVIRKYEKGSRSLEASLPADHSPIK